MNKIAKLLAKVSKNGFYIILFLCICAIGISGYVMFRAPQAVETAQTADAEDVLVLPFPEEDEEFPNEAVLSEPMEIPDEVVMAHAPIEPQEPAVQAAVKKRETKAETPRAVEYVSAVDGEISLPYSGEELIKSKTMGDWRVHTGVDIAAAEGTKVRAVAAGTVKDVLEDEMMGHTVVIEHREGCVSTYCNLMKGVVVKAGDRVEAGDVIGGIGASALAECMETPHLHLELTVDGKPVDPMEYITK